jgi:hypothetical protein
MIVNFVIGRPFRYCFHFLYQLVSFPFSVARAFLQGVKRPLLVPFLLWPSNIVAWRSHKQPPTKDQRADLY